MFRKISFILIFMFLISEPQASAQVDGPKEKASSLIEALMTGEIRTALDNGFEGSDFKILKPQEFEMLVMQSENIFQMLGDSHGKEYIRTEKITASLHRVIYQVFFDIAPLNFSIYYYKSKEHWKIINIKFNTSPYMNTPVVAKDISAPPKVVKVTENIIDGLIGKNSEKTLLDNIAFSENTDKEEAAVKGLLSKFDMIERLYGGFLGIERVRIEKYSEKFFRSIYVIKTEKVPIIVNVNVYNKPNGRWCGITVNFKDNLKGLERLVP